MSVYQYINQFERLINKIKQHGASMSSDILAYKLLKYANLPDEQEQFVKASVAEFSYGSVRAQIRKVFADSYIKSASGSQAGLIMFLQIVQFAVV